jgi:hypothetical protein
MLMIRPFLENSSSNLILFNSEFRRAFGKPSAAGGIQSRCLTLVTVFLNFDFCPDSHRDLTLYLVWRRFLAKKQRSKVEMTSALKFFAPYISR